MKKHKGLKNILLQITSLLLFIGVTYLLLNNISSPLLIIMVVAASGAMIWFYLLWFLMYRGNNDVG